MSKKIAINGFGRIGRLTFRSLLNNDDVEIVAINDLTDNATLAHLLKYDTAFGVLDHDVKVDGDYLVVDGKKILALEERDPSKLPWKGLDRKSTRLNSSHVANSYAVFCLKK